MREQDYDEFASMLADVWALKGQALTASQKAMFFRALAAFPLGEVRAGLDAHVRDPRRGQFLPMPADVIGQIHGIVADDGRPGAEEAWAIVLRGADESATVVWTEEAAQAWAVVAPILNGGDQVGARMAFKETYSRMVDEARRARRRPVWNASLGHDSSGHAAALEQAALLGRLPAPDRLSLPAPEESLAAIYASAPPTVREKLRDLRNWIANKTTGPSADQLARERTDELKGDATRKVAAYTRIAA